jgi:hypothetical protein
MKTHHVWIKRAVLTTAVAVSALAAGTASAQSIEDKLRAQLRDTTLQLRQLQDSQAQVQADKTSAEQQRDKALAELKQTQADLDAAKGKSSAEVAAERSLAAEKSSHAKDEQQLSKYKSSYEDLLAVSRSRDAERTRMETAQKASDAQLQTCEAKNVQLYQVGQEVLDAYEHIGVDTFLKSREPFAQSARVKYDQIAQDYGDKLYAGKYDPRATPAGSAAAANGAATPAASK